ncbi:thiol-activated cytolysin family protein [Algoriphagus halophytocola]|uniref:Thiol-activated cytolysin family protein n=1 Tax=Algoriphagus halophytocola TaxID=2991499 RepID=A0ABY6MG37_9BACT|nr:MULTISPECIES: thiol-activated cytolysin family protein [unclassified Algoriphagus]UZD22775.1 thiol-activated cytolysin family protein [Algoriphagus sp. TR-M5]WBL44041.1 thiol-activated cytolysin family protein [Algoriphagus sp. TR-M9]
MKALFKINMKAAFSFALVFLILTSCNLGEDDEPIKTSPDAESISQYIRNLNFDEQELFNVQGISGALSRQDVGGPITNTTPGQGVYTECKTQRVSLKSNFEEIAILRPTDGVIYPGALVVADKATLGGLPTPVTIDRSPIKLRLDLPGIGENGNIEVENASNTSVQSKIDEALEWWNANSKPDGYTIASNSSYAAATSYSSKQLSIDVGLNVDWARGDAQAQFNYTSSQSERVAMMVFKQRFYTITMNAPNNPGEVFGANATIADVESKFSPEGPPAYVHSVSYGRIIMFRMVTTETATDSELSGAFNYATGLTSASGSLEAKYKSILEKSSITVVTMGGSAEAASSAVTARNFGDLEEVLQGENAVYSRNNPGVPIAYSLKYLKDNTNAKLGYTTEYSIQNCEQKTYPSQNVSLNNKNGFLGVTMRFTIYYKQKSGGNTYNRTVSSGDIKTNTKEVKAVPSGAFDIRVVVEFKDGFKWKFLYDREYSRPTQLCMESTQSLTQVRVQSVSC